jgi:hypothetical protein
MLVEARMGKSCRTMQRYITSFAKTHPFADSRPMKDDGWGEHCWRTISFIYDKWIEGSSKILHQCYEVSSSTTYAQGTSSVCFCKLVYLGLGSGCCST